ncbi:SRPBCC family protein [Deinococcus multiflagellatus]|uniref:Carbon monoxide dehydrogenase subunit G n=1 Tax=Deinococcus multiflagellatus TaxID=1656887 RepID=A0ABW1ZMY6_9DEIO|nr:carbon monoxide dehydrogenase subunit G [Deinococcus multiflagellatus]MBZ9714179.1 carbon monoxide dehydrogenase subunit G [Deinococcus multiflagellatus]
MQFQDAGEFQVRAAPAVVWAFVQRPEQVARCLPEVQDIRAHPDHAEASVAVRAGLLRGTLHLRLNTQPDEAAQRVTVRVQGAGLGSTLTLNAAATLGDPGNGTTSLRWQGEVSVRGPLAAVGGRLMESRARALIERTFQNLQAQLNAAGSTLA